MKPFEGTHGAWHMVPFFIQNVMFLSIIIPVYNEEDSLPKVIADLPKELISEIIVVNNASTDDSVRVAVDLGCRVVDEPQRGYGKACLTGIAHLNPQSGIVVFIDGDHSDHGEALPDLVKPILKEGYDFIIGSRALGNRERHAMTPQAYYGNKLACFLMRLFWGARFTDLGPFRAIRRESLDKLRMQDQDFGWTIEMQIRAVERGLKWKEIPVDYRKRVGRSKISGTIWGTFAAGYKILWTIFKYRFLKRKKKV